MENRYDGKCHICGSNVPAGTGSVARLNGQWIVTHAGACPGKPEYGTEDIPSMDISSGLGIGGVGSDDYNIHTETPGEPITPKPKRPGGFGAHGIRYDEQCERCRRETEVCNWCGCCKNHCTC